MRSREYKCAYCYENEFVEELNEELVRKYLKKTRGINYKPTGNELNDGEKEIIGYDMKELYSLIRSRKNMENRIIETHVVGISPQEKTFTIRNNDLEFCELKEYKKILNTFPIQEFLYLIDPNYPKPRTENKSTIHLYLIEFPELFCRHLLSYYDFVYFIDEEIPYYRIYRTRESRIVCVESMTEDLGDFINRYEGRIWKHTILPFGKIADVGENILYYDGIKHIDYDGIKHIGRYANQTQSIRLHDVIKSLELGEINE
jgi:hypothetical protein